MAFIHNTQHDLYPFIDPATNPSLKDCAQGKTVLVTGAGQGIGKVQQAPHLVHLLSFSNQALT